MESVSAGFGKNRERLFYDIPSVKLLKNLVSIPAKRNVSALTELTGSEQVERIQESQGHRAVRLETAPVAVREKT